MTTRLAKTGIHQREGEFVPQDAASYQALLDKVQAAEDLTAIQEGLAQSIARLGRRPDWFGLSCCFRQGSFMWLCGGLQTGLFGLCWSNSTT
jgi:hypothetical protein